VFDQQALAPALEVTMARQRSHSTKSDQKSDRTEAKSAGNKSGVAARNQTDRKPAGWFHCFAAETARLSGRPFAFALAVALIVVWGVTGPLFGFSDTWQLVINTGTTIVTFLMVFLIQHTQNRDTLALQVKLAELIIAMHGAKNKVATAEEMSESDLEALHEAYRTRATETLDTLQARRSRAGAH
jgi:low affinity Fe/Cu permease